MPISDEIDPRPMRVLNAGLGVPNPAAPSRALSIPSLTGIRGVAAVWVLLTHYQAVLAAYLDNPAINDNSFLYNGFRGVDLFFVLSGFILMHVHENDFRQLESKAIPYHSHDFSAAGFVQSLLLAQSWTVLKLGEWNGPAWSLSAEVFAYAMFPVLAWTLIRARSALLCTVGALLSLAVLMGLLVVGHHTQDSPTGTFGLIRCVFGFTAGACMARAFQLRPASDRAASWLGAPIAWISVAIIAVALSAPRLNMFIVFGFCGLIYALAFQRGVFNAIFSSGPAMFLGRISFSLYMIHYIPLKLSIWLLQTRLDTASFEVRVACVVAIPLICIAIAMVAYYAIELPFQRFARSIVRRKRDVTLPTALAA
jgi:peptidoglycan/LPS O-acetylase OafA/YrhL